MPSVGTVPAAHKSRPTAGTLGFRVKSGWASAVVLVGPAKAPELRDRRIVELSDPAVPESKQPYHARTGMLEEDPAKLDRRIKIVRAAAAKAVSMLVEFCRDAGCEIRGAGLVVGSLIDPTSIKNPHIRAHALEGQLFRTVLEDSLRSHQIPCRVIVERNAFSGAETLLRCSLEDVKQTLLNLGRSQKGPWRVDDKLAALAAWLTLAAMRTAH